MAENNSSELNSVIASARNFADILNNSQIGTQHLVLGMLSDDKNKAFQILESILKDQKDTLIDKLKKSASLTIEENINNDFNFENAPRTDLAERAFTSASLERRKYKDSEINSVLVLLGILRNNNDPTTRLLEQFSIDYNKIDDKYVTTLGASKDYDLSEVAFMEFNENDTETNENTLANRINRINEKAKSNTPNLDKFGKDLSELAKKGKLDKVIGREKEIQRVSQILSRKRKNNPILIGEPGVGKSVIAEGIAIRILEKTVPNNLLDKRVVSLDLSSLVAGTKYRGQFEERMTTIISEIEKAQDVILFIDEIHTIVGAGNSTGGMDFSNMFKPALSRGDIQCIGATTLNEYRESIEKDGALERRFQKVIVNPTTIEETINILKNIKSSYEEFHNVTYTDEAIEACATLTDRYITDRFLPDKAVDALDEAGSRVNINKTDISSNEKVTVTQDDIADVVSMMSNIPVSKVAKSELDKLKSLDSNIKHKVIGQEDAVTKVVRSIKRNRTGLKDPNRPIGSFLFLGQTGVGKTQLAKVLGKELFDSEDSIIRVDMSEFMEKFAVSRLIGSPPGYVGYEEGGQLTEKVRRKPYSVLLLDEIEKAHPDVFNILLQILDDGFITDSLGRKVDFKNTIIIMTSNIGARQVKEFGQGIGFGTSAKNSQLESNQKSIIDNALKKVFAPEFLNRVDEIIMFNNLNKEDISKIIEIELSKVTSRLEKMGYSISISEKAIDFLSEKGFDKNYGARPLKRAIQQYVEDELAEQIVNESIKEGTKILIDFKEGDDKLSFIYNSNKLENI